MTNETECDIICKHDLYAPVAQLVEHLTFNQRVRDSSSRRSTNNKSTPCGCFYYWCSCVSESRFVLCTKGIRNIATRLAVRDLVSGAKFPQECYTPCGCFYYWCSCVSESRFVLCSKGIRNIATRLAARDLVSGAKFPQE